MSVRKSPESITEFAGMLAGYRFNVLNCSEFVGFDLTKDLAKCLQIRL